MADEKEKLVTSIQIRDIPLGLYHRAIAARGIMKTKTWPDFLEKIVTAIEEDDTDTKIKQRQDRRFT